MISLKASPKNIMAFALSGTVEKADIKTLEAAIAERLAGSHKLGVVVDMTKWSDITGDAIAEDMRFELSMLPQLHRFARVAIVSDKLFVKALFNYLKPLVPMIEVKVFTSGEADKAFTFASEASALKAV